MSGCCGVDKCGLYIGIKDAYINKDNEVYTLRRERNDLEEQNIRLAEENLVLMMNREACDGCTRYGKIAEENIRLRAENEKLVYDLKETKQISESRLRNMHDLKSKIHWMSWLGWR